MGIERDDQPTASRMRIAASYRDDKPGLIARLRRAGRSLAEAEDRVHDAYLELLEGLPKVPDIRNLPAWVNSTIRWRLVDSWRRERMALSKGEVEVSEETLAEIVAAAGWDPCDAYVREELADALYDAIRALPAPQRRVIEAQVFEGKTFRELAEAGGESVDTISSRKRYAVKALSKALRGWIEG